MEYHRLNIGMPGAVPETNDWCVALSVFVVLCIGVALYVVALPYLFALFE
jgi:hypothetical protein